METPRRRGGRCGSGPRGPGPTGRRRATLGLLFLATSVGLGLGLTGGSLARTAVDRTLTVQINTGGRVASDPAGLIDCLPRCVTTVAQGAETQPFSPRRVAAPAR